MLTCNVKPDGMRNIFSSQRLMGLVLWLCTALLAVVLVFVTFVPEAFSGGHDQFCSATSETAFTACGKDAEDDLYISRAICINISNNGARKRCLRDADSAFEEAQDECEDQLDAREEVCDLIGQARYEPDFDPDNFVDPDDIGGAVEPNPYLPLVVGNQWVYEGGGEIVTVTVLDKTKLIDGVTCRVVNDVVEEMDDDGEPGNLVEDTDDWFAQHVNGDVHYCGELARDFEYPEGDDPEEAELVTIDGSFKAGRDGAKSGLLVPAMPVVGQGYRQEWALGDAEDVVEVISVTGTASSPFASCTNECLVTRDFSPLDPGSEENKYYAEDVGLILEIDLESGERLELVNFENVELPE